MILAQVLEWAGNLFFKTFALATLHQLIALKVISHLPEAAGELASLPGDFLLFIGKTLKTVLRLLLTLLALPLFSLLTLLALTLLALLLFSLLTLLTLALLLLSLPGRSSSTGRIPLALGRFTLTLFDLRLLSAFPFISGRRLFFTLSGFTIRLRAFTILLPGVFSSFP